MTLNPVNARRADAGFTLLELLVATAVLGLVMVLIAGGVAFGGRAWRSYAARGDAVAATSAAESALRQLIAGARMLPRRGPGGETLPPLAGEPERLSFVGMLPAALGGDGLYDLTLALDARDRLELRWSPHRRNPVAAAEDGGEAGDGAGDEAEDGAGDGAGAGSGAAVLIAGVSGIALAYLVPATPLAPAQWAARWRETDALPRLIRIRLTLSQGAGRPRPWPDLVAAPGGTGALGVLRAGPRHRAVTEIG